MCYIKLLSFSLLLLLFAITTNILCTLYICIRYIYIYIVWATFSLLLLRFFATTVWNSFPIYLSLSFFLSLSLPYQTYVFIYSCNKSYRNKLLIIHTNTYIYSFQFLNENILKKRVYKFIIFIFNIMN